MNLYYLMITEIALSGLLFIVNSISIDNTDMDETDYERSRTEREFRNNEVIGSEDIAQNDQSQVIQERLPDEIVELYNILMSHAIEQFTGFYNSSFKFINTSILEGESTYLIYACYHSVQGPGLMVKIYDSETNEYQIGLYDYQIVRMEPGSGLEFLQISHGSFDGYIEHIQLSDMQIVPTDDLNNTILYREVVRRALELLRE